jgi:hypothetical protein
MSNLIEWIELGVSSPDPQIRTLNEEKLLKYRDTNPEEFLSICLEGYKDNNNKPTVRQAIATIFGMTIAQVVTHGVFLFISNNIIGTAGASLVGLSRKLQKPCKRDLSKPIDLRPTLGQKIRSRGNIHPPSPIFCCHPTLSS